MQLHTTARHCELGPENRLFAQQRFERLARFARDIHEAHLVVSEEGYRHQAEITLRLTGHDLVSHEQATEAHAAIDLAFDHIEGQLRRLKERRVSRKRSARGADGVALNGNAAEGEGEPKGDLETSEADLPLEDDPREDLDR